MIALVDCNSFFCSCERLFRPELNGLPVIVLSNNDGCAIARTNEAKRLGIDMGAPYFQIKDVCKKKNVSVFSSNFSLYTNISDRVMNVLRGFTDRIEVYSVDEAFLSLSGFEQNFDLLEYGRKIQSEVMKLVGIPVSIGIAPTKVLAKVANRVAKKSDKAKGVVVLDSTRLQDVALERTEIEDVWGIGRRNAAKLKAMGVYNAKQFRDFKNERVIQRIFTKVGLQIKWEMQGKICFPLEEFVEKKKEIMASRSFGAPVFDKNAMKESVANYITSAAEKLRGQGSTCNRVEVYMRTSPFKETPQYYAHDYHELLSSTLDTRKLIEIAHELVENIFRPGFEYKKAGVRLCDLQDRDQAKLSFLERGDSQEDEELMKTMDIINQREGKGTLKSMACGVDNKAWKMLRNFKSPRYTTSWWELPRVK